jgi:hypothetical protein
MTANSEPAKNRLLELAEAFQPNNPARQYLIAYLDLLGYGDLVNNLPASWLLCAKLEYVFRTELTSASGYGMRIASYDKFSDLSKKMLSRITFRLMSDSLVISLPLSDWFSDAGKAISSDERVVLVESFLACLSLFSIKITTEIGLVYRGAVLIGYHYECNPTPESQNDNLFVISPALVEAVKLEEDIADAPRVLIATSLLKYLQSLYPTPRFPLEEDGWTFRDYSRDGQHCLNLYHVAVQAILSKQDPDGSAKKHLETLTMVLSTHVTETKMRPKILNKYLWLVNYHNQQMEKLQFNTLKLDLSKLLN